MNVTSRATARPEGGAGEAAVPDLLRSRDSGREGGEITLRKLQVFWAVAHATSLTRAAKLLGVTQPSLSQQLAGFEQAIGFLLFERRSNAMVLTEAGRALLGRAESVLRAMNDLEDGLSAFRNTPRQTLRVAGINSVMKLVLPGAIARISSAAGAAAGEGGGIDFDLHESSPAEILDLLNARRISVGLLAANSVAELGSGYHEEPILSDRQLLVLPEGLDLSAVTDPDCDLDREERALLQSTIQFAFGTQHAQRIQSWFDTVVPGNRLVARSRSYELVVEMVRAGLGVGVVPALSVAGVAGEHGAGVTLHETGLPARRIVAMMPAQYRRHGTHSAFIAALRDAGQAVRLPEALPLPPFVRRRLEAL
jgi:DNA-binding transcriptional LysR family regulator